MKIQVLLTLATAALLASCVSPIEHRLQKHPELFAKLSETDKKAVASGQIREGMSKDAVFLAWGRPARASIGKREGKGLERWYYVDYEPFFNAGFGGGVGFYGRHGDCRYREPMLYGGPAVDYVPVEGRSVDFVNDRVNGFLIRR